MKITFKTIALFAALSLTAMSCQKEEIVSFIQEESVSNETALNTMLYSVDGVQHAIILHSESDYQNFIHEMMNLARLGHNVVFCDENNVNQSVTKDVVYYSTSSQAEAESWALKMVKDGYQVTVSYDENTKMYNCVAIK